MKRTVLIKLLPGLLFILAACSQEPRLVAATQVIVTVRSDLRAELGTVEATVYDVSESKQGDKTSFDLGAHPLPLSFTVFPSLATTTAFLLVLKAKDPQGTELLQTKALVQFVTRTTLGVEVWLSEACIGRSCEAGEVCSRTADSEATCGPAPTLVGKPTVPGKELDGLVSEVAPVTSMNDAASGALEGEDGGDRVDASMPDASVGSDASNAPLPPVAMSACLGTPDQAVCSDKTLLDCNAAGEVARQESCQSARQCQLGLAAKSCAPCDPGSRRCTGARLERCADDGSKWEVLKTCESEALCNAVAGDCVAGTCTATTRVCMSNKLYGCSQDLTQLTMLKDCGTGTCDQVNGECDICTPSARICSNNVVEACDTRGQTLSRTECTGGTPKCTGNGQCVQCTLPADCPMPSNACLAASCTAATARCGTTPRAAHATCTGGVCNGSGACVECVDGTDCKNANARVCSNNRCVACLQNTDCPGGYECTNSRTCQKVSLAGTATGCLSTAAPSGGNCGGFYCGVTQQRLATALSSSAVCNITAATACSAVIPDTALKCTQMFVLDAVLDPTGFRTKTANCTRTGVAQAGHTVSNACIDCFVEVERCCATDSNCSTVCLTPGVDCDNARKAAGCFVPAYSCSGLPSPF